MFLTPFIKRISNTICPSVPIKYKLTEVVVDDPLYEVVIHCV